MKLTVSQFNLHARGENSMFKTNSLFFGETANEPRGLETSAPAKNRVGEEIIIQGFHISKDKFIFVYFF